MINYFARVTLKRRNILIKIPFVTQNIIFNQLYIQKKLNMAYLSFSLPRYYIQHYQYLYFYVFNNVNFEYVE